MCIRSRNGLLRVPPSPQIMAELYARYVRVARPLGLSFRQYLVVIGYADPAESNVGMDDSALFKATPEGPQLISVPGAPILGTVRVKVLLVDFSDQAGTLPASHYEQLLFSKGTFPTGSMRDFYLEASAGKVDVTGTVHGWLRMPQPYSFYTNNESGTEWGSYPRNAPRMAEDAVRAAQAAGVAFEPRLDLTGRGIVSALFIVHAGLGAEGLDPSIRGRHIWSHKWSVRNPIQVGPNLSVTVYLTVPNDARVGVCSHELGHLAFQWEDFYDPNYAEDGSEWDGSGDWDLMAGGSWNGSGARPAHPAALHKTQHRWVEVQDVRTSTRLTLDPFTATSGKVVKLVSSKYRQGQYLLLENRRRSGFDSDLPGQGLLVWRVDESMEMTGPREPAMLLLQADGRHDLEQANDWNQGDAGDPFPGEASRTELNDQGDLSTTFPQGDRSGIVLRNIQRDATSGRITLDVVFDGAAPPPPTGGGGPSVLTGEATPNLLIPDNAAAGVESTIKLQGAAAVREVTVAVDILHPYVGDLRVELISPSGLKAVLQDRQGGNGKNLQASWKSSDLPALAALAGGAVAGDWRLRVTDVAAADAGTLRRWTLSVSTADAGAGVHEKRTPKAAIPDNDPNGVAFTIPVARAGLARTVGVSVDLTHSYVGDLRIELAGPNGQRALLQNRSGGSTKNLKRTWTSADTPALAPLVGISVQGDWVLRVSDLAGQDAGTLNEWALDVDLAPGLKTAQAEAAPRAAIPDNVAAGIGSAVAIDAVGTVQSVELKARIVHPYVGDLRVELVAPSGLRAVVHDRAGGRSSDLILQLDSASSPPLAALAGQPLGGPWLLRVADMESLDAGTFESWALKVTYSG